MAHSDDDGLVLPPKLAPIQVVIVPIYKSVEQLEAIKEYINPVMESLKKQNVSVKLDDRDTHKPGWKFAEYELKGVPVRVAVGPKDMENGVLEVARRDTREKQSMNIGEAVENIQTLLDAIQTNIYQKAINFREEKTTFADDYESFKSQIEAGGFVYAHWDGTEETEERIKEETKATIRCIPLQGNPESGQCILSGKPSKQRVVFAKAY